MTTSPLRVGVVGTTTYAETHMRNIAAHPRATLAAIAGRDVERTARVAHSYGAPHAFSGYEALLDSGTVDAVAVLAPDELHEPIALAAFERGLPVLCEKPLSRTAASAQRMAAAAQAAGVVNMSYFFLRATPHHRYLAALLASGEIGAVRSGAFTLSHGFFRGPDYNWRFDAARGGGVIADLGCYLFDLAGWYIGDVEAVAAHGRSTVERTSPDGAAFVPSADSAVGFLTFAGGAHATFEIGVVSTVPGKQLSTVALQGETGRIELVHTFAGASLRMIRAGEDDWSPVTIPADFAAQNGDDEFIDAIGGGAPVASDFSNGWRVQRVVEAAEDAARTGRLSDVERAS